MRTLTAILSFALAGRVFAGVVYENQTEFFTTGDFNGDGVTDILVLDKSTGNARVGYLNAAGSIAWSAPLATGTENVSGCAAGRFLKASRDGIAVTSADLNRVNLADLSNSNSAPSPTVVSPAGIGAHSIAALASPLGGAAPAYNFLLVASSLNPPPQKRLDLLGLNSGAASPVGQYPETGSFDRPNALPLPSNGPTLAAGLVRGGTNDSLDIWQFTNSPSVLATASNLPSNGDYAFGQFNGELLPRFLFYQPGQSNVTVMSLLQTNGAYVFGPPLAVSLTNAVTQVFYTAVGSNGAFQINFGGAIQGLRLPGSVPSLTSPYGAAAGSVVTGMAPLQNGTFALLDAPAGSPISMHASIVRFDGTNYTQISSSNMPSVTTSATRANVWLFDSEPFVSQSLGFIESLSAPVWSVSAAGLPGSDNVTAESDGGPTNGLSTTPSTNSFGAPPSPSKFALVNQYNDAISVFSYGSPRPPESANVLISPPPGAYQPPIQVSFTVSGGGSTVYYNTGPTNGWHLYSAPFSLIYNTTVTYFASNSAAALRSRLQTANYLLGNAGPPPSPIVDKPGTDTNAEPPITTNVAVLSSAGTVFYGRRAADNTGTIWCVNLDGSGETYITSGARPRVSRDGKWLAFLRDGNPFANQGNLYARNLLTGTETLLVNNTNTIVHYDWDATGTNLVFDYNCLFYRVNLFGQTAAITASPVCDAFAPAVNPATGGVAYFDLNPNSRGIFVATSNFTAAGKVSGSITGARWPEWSPDGQALSFVNGALGVSVDGGMDLWIVNADGTGLNAITAISGDGTNGFPHGAVWSPDGGSLVAAGTIYGTNGLWVIPLTADHTSCDCAEPLTPLPISPGDPVDFAGSTLAAAVPPITNFPSLYIRLDPTMVVVYWSTNNGDYTLQTSAALPGASPAWSGITGPYYLNGSNIEYDLPRTNLLTHQYFRLNLTGAFVAAPQ
ncbi:MAG TPA: hypothetical protein VGO59_02230 [Verrucomicrobiae bacterium]|jgi:hypothetical protein